ncbi:hypothetical protein ACOSQ4_014470 [Xanthoceras sorbifolium]
MDFTWNTNTVATAQTSGKIRFPISPSTGLPADPQHLSILANHSGQEHRKFGPWLRVSSPPKNPSTRIGSVNSHISKIPVPVKAVGSDLINDHDGIQVTYVENSANLSKEGKQPVLEGDIAASPTAVSKPPVQIDSDQWQGDYGVSDTLPIQPLRVSIMDGPGGQRRDDSVVNQEVQDCLSMGGVRERLLHEMQHKVLRCGNGEAMGVCVPFKFGATARTLKTLDHDPGVLSLKSSEKQSQSKTCT